MDVGKSIRFVFEDKDWVSKLLIGVLVSIVPILNFAFIGYLVQMLRNVVDGISYPLPDWSDFGDKFVKGLILIVVAFIYLLPVIIISAALGGIGSATSAATSGDVADVVSGLFAGLGVLVSCIVGLYSLAFTFFYYALAIHFSKEGTFGSCFEVGKIVKLISSHLGEYVTAWVVALLLGIALVIVGGIAFTILAFIPCIGWIAAVLLGAFLAVWPNIVIFHLFGQVGALAPKTA